MHVMCIAISVISDPLRPPYIFHQSGLPDLTPNFGLPRWCLSSFPCCLPQIASFGLKLTSVCRSVFVPLFPLSQLQPLASQISSTVLRLAEAPTLFPVSACRDSLTVSACRCSSAFASACRSSLAISSFGLPMLLSHFSVPCPAFNTRDDGTVGRCSFDNPCLKPPKVPYTRNGSETLNHMLESTLPCVV